jgi:hypothetical protein
MNQKMEMISNPDMKMVKLKGVEKHTDSKAMVFWDTKTKDVYLMPKVYQKLRKECSISFGLLQTENLWMQVCIRKKKTAKLLLPTSKCSGFCHYTGKKGGSPVPTMENMYVMGGV